MAGNKGLLIVVSGPSGCGKGTILSEVLKSNENIYYSVSSTTRKPRDGEIDGKNYCFINKEQFEELISNGGMLEYTNYCDNYYGTQRKQVEDMLCAGKDVILEIEVKGATNIKKSCPDVTLIFILPPSIKELRRRLDKRGTENQEAIDKRVSEAVNEVGCADKYDYVIVNDHLEDAIYELKAVMTAEKLTKKRAANKIEEVLNNA